MAFEPLNNLQGKVAVIVGGFGGIGFASAERLATKGAKIALITRDLSKHDVDKYRNSLEDREATFIQADVTDFPSLDQAAAEVQTKYGKVDILVNAAGKNLRIDHLDFGKLTPELFRSLLNVNCVGPYATIRAFYMLMKMAGEAVVINISSTSAEGLGGANLAYGSSKAALDALTRNAAKAMAPDIRVVSVSPSGVDTTFIGQRPPGFYEKAARQTPLGRVVMPDDVAAMVEALCTTMRFTTGHRFVIDGGRTI